MQRRCVRIRQGSAPETAAREKQQQYIHTSEEKQQDMTDKTITASPPYGVPAKTSQGQAVTHSHPGVVSSLLPKQAGFLCLLTHHPPGAAFLPCPPPPVNHPEYLEATEQLQSATDSFWGMEGPLAPKAILQKPQPCLQVTPLCTHLTLNHPS